MKWLLCALLMLAATHCFAQSYSTCTVYEIEPGDIQEFDGQSCSIEGSDIYFTFIGQQTLTGMTPDCPSGDGGSLRLAIQIPDGVFIFYASVNCIVASTDSVTIWIMPDDIFTNGFED